MSALEDFFRSLANGPKFEQPKPPRPRRNPRYYEGGESSSPDPSAASMLFIAFGGFGDGGGSTQITSDPAAEHLRHHTPIL